MTKFIKSFGWAMNGLRAVWREERNFRFDVAVGALVVIAAFFMDFPEWKWIFLVLIIGWVLMGEVVNTVVEDLCNKVQPNQDPVIGKIKDMMAGYVFISAISAALAGILLFLL